MRLVTFPDLCKACLEGLWLSLLQRVNLIEGVHEECIWTPASFSPFPGHWKKRLEVQLIPLARLRVEPISATETFTIIWTKDGQVLEDFTNKTRIEVDDGEALGTFSIDVKFATEEVRKDPHGRLTSRTEYTISHRCRS